MSRAEIHLKHGLAAKKSRATSARVLKLAQNLSPKPSGFADQRHALIAAEAHLRLADLRKLQEAIMAPLWMSLSVRSGNAPPEVVSLVVSKLDQLERYERRALSRRRSALRALRKE